MGILQTINFFCAHCLSIFDNSRFRDIAIYRFHMKKDNFTKPQATEKPKLTLYIDKKKI